MVRTYNPYEVKNEQDIRHYGVENKDMGPTMDAKFVGQSFNVWADRFRMMRARYGLDKKETYVDGTVHNGGAGTVTQWRQVGTCVYAQAISPAFNRPINGYAFPNSPAFPYVQIPTTDVPTSDPITCAELFALYPDMSDYEKSGVDDEIVDVETATSKCWATTCADFTYAELAPYAVAAAADYDVVTPGSGHDMSECWTIDVDCLKLYAEYPELDPFRSASGVFPDCWDVVATCEQAWAVAGTPVSERKTNGVYPDCWLSSDASAFGEGVILCSDIHRRLPSIADDIAADSANYVINDPDGTHTIDDCYDTPRTCAEWWALIPEWDDLRKAGVETNTDGDCWDFSPTTCADLFKQTSGYDVQIVTPSGTKQATPKPGGTYPDCWNYGDDVCKLVMTPPVQTIEEFADQVDATVTFKLYKYVPCPYGEASRLWLEGEALRGLSANDPYVTFTGDAISSIAVSLSSVDILYTPKGKASGVIEYDLVCTIASLSANTDYKSKVIAESCIVGGDSQKASALLVINTLPPQYTGSLSLGASVDGGAVYAYRSTSASTVTSWPASFGDVNFPYACPVWTQPLPPSSVTYRWYPYLQMVLYKKALYVGKSLAASGGGPYGCAAAYRTGVNSIAARYDYCTAYPGVYTLTDTVELDPTTGKPTIDFSFTGNRGGYGTYEQCVAYGQWNVRIVSEGVI